jgi:hypothetical protein
MTKGDTLQLSFSAFLTLFRLPHDVTLHKLHDEGPLEAKRMTFMYPRSARSSSAHVKELYTYYAVLNCLFRKTFIPRDGNSSDITAFHIGISKYIPFYKDRYHRFSSKNSQLSRFAYNSKEHFAWGDFHTTATACSRRHRRLGPRSFRLRPPASGKGMGVPLFSKSSHNRVFLGLGFTRRQCSRWS